jgi:transposase
MSRPIAPDYTQSFLLPPSLEEWVPADHPARFVREFVDALDLESLGFAMPAGTEGRPGYAPSLMVKLWLCGYVLRIRSCRKLEAACREQLSLLWLSGMIQPDHNSLWRFWRANQAGMRELFRQSVQLAVRSGCVGLALQAVDGTKLAAACSNQTGWTKAQMEKLLAGLDAAIAEVELEVLADPADETQPGYRLPAGLAERQALRAAVETGLAQLQEEQRGHYHPHEPEARRMKVGGQKRFGYNAQVVTDGQHGIITAAEVSREETDVGQLAPMIEQARENVGVAAQSTPTLADRGYGAGADIQAAQDQQMKVLVPPNAGNPGPDSRFAAERFHYDAAERTVRCPEGRLLRYQGPSTKHGQRMERYRCPHRDCPVRSSCTSNPRGRSIDIYPHTPAVQAMRAELALPEVWKQYRRRAGIVERSFAQIKEHDGFRRFTLRGLEAVRTQWAMICAAVNLRTLHVRWKTRPDDPRGPRSLNIQPTAA